MSYVDDGAQLPDVLDFGAKQLPDGFLLVALTLAQLVVVGDYVDPVPLQLKHRLVVLRPTERQQVGHLRQTVAAVAGQQLGQLLVFVLRLQHHHPSPSSLLIRISPSPERFSVGLSLPATTSLNV